MEIDESARRVKEFEGDSLTNRLSELEYLFQGLTGQDATSLCDEHGLNSQLLDAAYQIKALAGQIHVVIHAAGILTSLPTILEEGEEVESLSLGAGNTGRQFDLETNLRVAEFKFIHWKGGPESIRQNSLFKDFFELAEADTNKRKYLYVLGLTQPLKFFHGRRSLSSVMSRNAALAQSFFTKYDDSFSVVSDYFETKKNEVAIVDLTPMVPALAGIDE